MEDLSDEDFVVAMRVIRRAGVMNMPPQDLLQSLGSIDDFSKALSAFISPSPIAGLWVLSRLIGATLARQVETVPVDVVASITLICAGILMNEAMEACDQAMFDATRDGTPPVVN